MLCKLLAAKVSVISSFVWLMLLKLRMRISAIFPNSLSGACGVVALLFGSEIIVAHVGDCRAILQCGAMTLQLTKDHRGDDPEEFKRISAAGGRMWNGRVGGVLIPSRSFGDMDVRLKCGEGVIVSEPDLMSISVDRYSAPHSPAPATNEPSKQFTYLLLASDGVFDALRNEEAFDMIENALQRSRGNAEHALNKLLQHASKITSDDVSAGIVVWCDRSADSYSTRAADSMISRIPSSKD